MRSLLRKYETQIARDQKAAAQDGFRADLMDDLHNVALDM